MANVGYIRVSTQEQNLKRQEEALAFCDKFFEEKISGKNMERPELKKMLAYVREGDTVWVSDFSRLSRSLRDLLSIVHDLTERKVNFASKHENIDTSTPQGQLQLAVFGACYQFQREMQRQSQREGIDIALAENKPYGRPKAEITEKLRKVYPIWKSDEITAREAMHRCKMKPNTFYKLVKLLDAEYERKGIPMFDKEALE